MNEPELINITPHPYDTSQGETAMKTLKSLLLKQPDALVFPELPDNEVMNLMAEEVAEEGRYCITRMQANSAVEGLLAFLGKYSECSKVLLKVATGVVNQRLLRRLCENCRQPFQPHSSVATKLGIPPGRVQVLYQTVYSASTRAACRRKWETHRNRNL